MTVTIKDLDRPNEPSLNLQASLDTASLVADFQQTMQVESGKAVERAMGYAERLSREIIERVRIEILGISKPKVMAVEVNKITSKLSKPASPYLGDCLVNAQLGINTLLVGPAGCGKTSIAHQVAEGLGRAFEHVCLSAGASETWLFGRQTPNGFMEGPFSRAYRSGGVFLADEYDAADSNMLLALNTATAPGSDHFFNPISGEIIKKHVNFVFMAAANTFGLGANGVYTGRNRIDAASLDRFSGGVISVDYSKDIEEQVCPDKEIREKLLAARKALMEMKAEQVVSTRSLMAAYQLKSANVEWEDIITRLTASWPQELPKQIGLREESTKKAKKAKVREEEIVATATAEDLF